MPAAVPASTVTGHASEGETVYAPVNGLSMYYEVHGPGARSSWCRVVT